MKQLVTILLDNAFKYSDAKGVITISLTRFYRIDSSRSRQSGGCGLGLSIAESIVKKHKGQISVKSDGKNYTDFCILLP